MYYHVVTVENATFKILQCRPIDKNTLNSQFSMFLTLSLYLGFQTDSGNKMRCTFTSTYICICTQNHQDLMMWGGSQFKWVNSHRNTDSKFRHASNYLIGIFTHLVLCLADAIHNFKWVKVIRIRQNWGQRFWNIVYWCHIIFIFNVFKRRYLTMLTC